MIAGYTVKDLKAGDVVRIWINEKVHWGIVVVDKYPDEKNVYISIVTSSYCYTKNVVEITEEDFPPINRKSMCGLEFKPYPREKILQNWVGRLERRELIVKLLNAWFSEINSMRALQAKQLAELTK